MKALLLKDALAQKPNLVLGGLYSLIFFVAFGLIREAPASGFIYVFTGVVVGVTILLGSFKLDANDTPRFMFSLPISRSTAVNEKFVLLALGTIYGTLCAVVFGAIFTIPAIGWSTGFITGLDLLRIVAGMMIVSFFIPLYFRVGHTIIRYVLIIGVGLLVGGQVVAMLSLSSRQSPGRAAAFLDFIFGWLQGGGDTSRTLTIAAIGAGVMLVSYAASQLIWRRRDA
jgi:ABC-2 family transporter